MDSLEKIMNENNKDIDDDIFDYLDDNDKKKVDDYEISESIFKYDDDENEIDENNLDLKKKEEKKEQKSEIDEVELVKFEIENKKNEQNYEIRKKRAEQSRKNYNLEKKKQKEIEYNNEDYSDLFKEIKKTKKIKFRFQSKSLFATYSQANDLDKETILEFFKTKNCDIIVVGEEKHQKKQYDEFEGKHFHCYVEFKEKLRTYDERFFDINGFHPNIAYPKFKCKVIKYCTKGKNYVEFGIDVASYLGQYKAHRRIIGKELLETQDLVTITEKYPEIIWSFGLLKTNLNMYLNMKRKRIGRNNIKCFWLVGRPGVGKTYSVLHRFAPEKVYVKENSKWWDGYVDQPIVLFDDFDKTSVSYCLKRWADQYDLTGEIKGGQVCLYYNVLIITSNYTIEELFVKPKPEPDCTDEKTIRDYDISLKLCQALLRRFKVYHCIVMKGENFIKLPKEIDELPY